VGISAVIGIPAVLDVHSLAHAPVVAGTPFVACVSFVLTFLLLPASLVFWRRCCLRPFCAGVPVAACVPIVVCVPLVLASLLLPVSLLFWRPGCYIYVLSVLAPLPFCLHDFLSACMHVGTACTHILYYCAIGLLLAVIFFWQWMIKTLNIELSNIGLTPQTLVGSWIL